MAQVLAFRHAALAGLAVSPVNRRLFRLGLLAAEQAVLHPAAVVPAEAFARGYEAGRQARRAPIVAWMPRTPWWRRWRGRWAA